MYQAGVDERMQPSLLNNFVVHHRSHSLLNGCCRTRDTLGRHSPHRDAREPGPRLIERRSPKSVKPLRPLAYLLWAVAPDSNQGGCRALRVASDDKGARPGAPDVPTV
jgi:hypothetical protein